LFDLMISLPRERRNRFGERIRNNEFPFFVYS